MRGKARETGLRKKMSKIFGGIKEKAK